MPVTLTIDLEDPTERYMPDGRWVELTHRLLDLCDEIRCRATFFTVGLIADAAPELIKEIASRGHEVAYHSHAHVALTDETHTRFRQESKADKDRIEQIIGKAVVGFRAPRFSLTPQTTWALDALVDLGFRYSSSIMPTGVSLYGFPGAPTTAFRWPNGLVEFPLPVASMGGWQIPYLGGVYLYTLPSFIARRWLRKAGADDVLWTYTHPYDFDREQAFKSMPNTPHWVSFVLWLSRRVAQGKIRAILKEGTAAPLGERLNEIGPKLQSLPALPAQ